MERKLKKEHTKFIALSGGTGLEQAKLNVSAFVDETYKNFIYPKNYGQLNPSLDITPNYLI